MVLLLPTIFVFIITLLEALDAGMVSSFFPVPLLWAGLMLLLLRERHTTLSMRMRRGLTIAVTFFTIALVSTHGIGSGIIGLLIVALSGALAALFTWCVTNPSYALDSLPQDRPR